MIKYSILVPVYNVEEYLRKCVDSLLDQDFPKERYEIILVDDGSTDSSGSICDEYSEGHSNIRTIHQNNMGLLMARGTGVRNSTGEYLLFVDSDDYVEADLLPVVDANIEKTQPDFLVFGFVKESGNCSRKETVTNSPIEVLDGLAFLSLFTKSEKYNSVCAKVIKGCLLRDNADKIYNTRINVAEDKLQTAYIIGSAERITFICDCPYHYVERNSSIAHYKTERDIFELIGVYQRIERLLVQLAEGHKQEEQEYDKLLYDYRSTTVNEAMDHIYKYNKRTDTANEEKLRALKKLVTQQYDFFEGNYFGKPRLKAYNVLRYNLLIRKHYRALLQLDVLLWRFQGITRLNKK